MQKLILAAGLATVLAVPAYAQSNVSTSTNTSANMASKAPTTKQFVDKTAMTNMFEIQAGKIAQDKSKNKDVDNYAKMIIQDHQKAQSKLKSTAQNTTLPTKLDQTHQQKISQLKSESGAKFLRTFKTQQVQGHQQAVQLAQSYAQNGDNAQLKQLAQTMVPTLQKHLQEARQLPTSASSAPTVGSSSSSR